MIGLGVIINGLFFTLPKGLKNADLSEETSDKSLSELSENPALQTLFTPPQPSFQHLSVVENTTRNLVESQAVKNQTEEI